MAFPASTTGRRPAPDSPTRDGAAAAVPRRVAVPQLARSACRQCAAAGYLLVLGLGLLGLPRTGAAEEVASTAAATVPPQVPLCMIGDSITWAQEGDWWRAYLLEQLPALAFVGTHSACLGYSHAGEGGNGTQAVLARLPAIPDCPYYSLLIGTNDNSTRDETAVDRTAAATAGRIVAIVQGLLAKPSAKRVFLSSVLPCHTDNPLRDRTNARTNVIVREALRSSLPADRVVYVDYETPIRQTPNWEPMIRLHPTREGYRLLARLLAEAIASALGLQAPFIPPRPAAGTGVRIDNLWEGGDDGHSRVPLIAGWYTVSCDVLAVTGPNPALTLTSRDPGVKQPLSKTFALGSTTAGSRACFELFTGYEGYGYTRSAIVATTQGCRLGRILLEKRRPSGVASAYGEGSYLDTVTAPVPGELVERPG